MFSLGFKGRGQEGHSLVLMENEYEDPEQT